MFCDSEGIVLLQFNKEVSVESMVHAELMAFREGILIAAALHWAFSHSFLFESVSQSVLAWVGNLLLAL